MKSIAWISSTVGIKDAVPHADKTAAGGGFSPRAYVRTFPPEASSASGARHLARDACRQWNRPDVAETVELLATELVANAIRYAQAPIDVRLIATPCGIRVEVSDDSPRRPVQQNPDQLAESGRGLWLIDAMADRWGVDAHTAGKRVWAEIT